MSLDEKLTNAVFMEASKKNGEWEKQYKTYSSQLDEELLKLRNLSEQLNLLSATQSSYNALIAANNLLSEKEDQAFSLIRKGSSKAAKSILDGREYWHFKSDYLRALSETTGVYINPLNRSVNVVERLSYIFGFGLLLISLVIARVWKISHDKLRAWYNIQELLNSERSRLEGILDNTLEGVITINEKALITHCNKAALGIFGYSRDDLLGKNVKMLMPFHFAKEHDQYVKNYVATGEKKVIGTIGREVEGQRKSGEMFPLSLAVTEFYAGGQRYFTGMVRVLSLIHI